MTKHTLNEVEWDYADDVVTTDGKVRGCIERSLTSTGHTFLIIRRHDTQTVVALRPEQVMHDPNPPSTAEALVMGDRVLHGVRTGTVAFVPMAGEYVVVRFDDGIVEHIFAWALTRLYETA
jgi:hypothetical protein